MSPPKNEGLSFDPSAEKKPDVGSSETETEKAVSVPESKPEV